MDSSIVRAAIRTRRTSLVTFSIILALAGSIAGSAAQGTSVVTVGASTVEYSDDWSLLGADDQSAVFQHPADPYAMVQYSELEDGRFPFADNADLIEIEAIGLFENSGMASDIEFLESGTLADGSLWQLYAMRIDGVRSFLLVTGNTDLVHGSDVLSMLLMPEANLIAAHVATRDGITVNGEPVPVAQVDQEAIVRAASVYLLEAIAAAPRMPGPPAQPAP